MKEEHEIYWNDKETARYILNYFSEFLTDNEGKAVRHSTSLYKLEGSDSTTMKRMYEEKGWLSSDQHVLDLLKNGYDAFELKAAKRILAEHKDKVFLNNCPACNQLARTPYARQCRCGHSWRANNRYQILESLPPYGPMYVSVSENEDFFSQGFAVRFFRRDSTSWVANFEPGWSGLNEIHELNGIPDLLVIAGGMCYIMNPEETKPLTTFGANYLGSLKTPDGRLVLYDFTEITIVETNGEYWHSERISWDGMKALELDGNLVKGLAYDPTDSKNEWKTFLFDLDTRIIEGGSFPSK